MGSIQRKYDEMMLREILRSDSQPAIIFVEWMHNYYYLTGTNVDEYHAMNGQEWQWSTWQDESHNFLATYYEIPMVSARDGLLHSIFLSSAETNLGPRWNVSAVFNDGLHPTAFGHVLLAQIVVSF